MTETLALTLLIFIAALLYSSVGHAGASGYLAAMALFGLVPDVIKPTALVLNLVVATVGTIRFASAGLKPVAVPRALIFGAGMGLLSGLTGVGGGIFLSPLLLFLGWADVKKTAGISVAFILVNSAAGLLGHLASVKNVPHEIVWWSPAALLGGIIGAELGSRRLEPVTMRRLLSVVLVVAGVKMLLTR